MIQNISNLITNTGVRTCTSIILQGTFYLNAFVVGDHLRGIAERAVFFSFSFFHSTYIGHSRFTQNTFVPIICRCSHSNIPKHY